MRFFGIPGQVVRVLILGIAVIVLLFLVRQRFVPESFGEIGHCRKRILFFL